MVGWAPFRLLLVLYFSLLGARIKYTQREGGSKPCTVGSLQHCAAATAIEETGHSRQNESTGLVTPVELMCKLNQFGSAFCASLLFNKGFFGVKK
jgi:hypothetical protein